MALTAISPDMSSLQIDVYDGTRELLAPVRNVLYRVIDGNQKQIYTQELKTSSLSLEVPFYDNLGDNYTVIAWSGGYRQAGFTPVKLSHTLATTVDLMLIPKDPGFNFSSASWDAIKAKMPFLASGVSDPAGRARYEDLLENKPDCLAALLNITTAMGQINLPKGTPLDYLKQIEWDNTLAQDRFFAYCDAQLIDQVRTAAAQGVFAPEVGPGFFHPGATASWKQVQFGEANVQLTFHEGEKATIDGIDCLVVEPDIDYYKDLGAHFLLEGLPNAITGGLTNPEMVYVLRWIAGRHAGVPEFDPQYVIVG
jgi:hypothetical protein